MQHEPEQPDTLAAYVAGGLSPDERQRLERRAATDPQLAGELEELMALDASLTQSAGVTQVLAGLEDRLAAAIETTKPLRTWAVHPMVRRAAVATAACLLLGTAGYFASNAMDGGQLPLWVSDQPRFTSRGSLRYLNTQTEVQDRLLQRGDLAGKISALKSTATDLTRHQKYNDALGVINQILVLDPNDDYANGAKQLVQDKAVISEQRKYLENHEYQFSKQLNRTEEAKIPHDEILKYPSDWPDLSARRDQSNAPERGDEVTRWIEDGIPDYRDAPSFNLSSTSGTTTGGGAPSGGLFGGRKSALISPYAPGSDIKPFKPTESAQINGGTLNAPTLILKNGQNVYYADGHAEFAKKPPSGTQKDNIYFDAKLGEKSAPFKNTEDSVLSPGMTFEVTKAAQDGPADEKKASGTGLVQPPELTISSIEKSVSVPDSGTLILGGQTLNGESAGTVETGVRARRQEIVYNHLTALEKAAAATDGADFAGARNAINAAKVAREAAKQDYTPAEQRKMDEQIAAAQIKLDEALLRDDQARRTSPSSNAEVAKNERVIAERENTVKALARNAADLARQGKNAEAQAVVNQILVIDPNNAAAKNGTLLAQVDPGAAPPTTQGAAVVAEARKVIRTGEVVFEIDRFDSAAGTIGKIVGENAGVVVTINSDKLPNGKVRGQMIVRVPPDRLDTFVLQLRGLGELKSQRLGSSDITKEYYDLASDLRAARAMEERLLAIIKNGSGAIKDLLEAEKELANWRGKIEKIVGQQKYYDNLVSMATLTVTLFERDIATAAATTERETINSGIESDDVEKARTQALEILGEAKARIISSDLKKLDAGQVASTIVADIPPDNAAAVTDRIKQLGKVARLEVQRSMSADANAPATPASKVERKESRLTLSLYNVANVQPRVSTNIELASADAAGAYNAIAAKAIKAGGRVVRGGASLQRGNTASGDGVFEVPADAGEAFLNDLKALGDVVSMSTTEAPDASNVTTSKRGFTVQITPAANLPPRQAAAMRVEARDVDAASANLQATLLAAGGRVLDASTATDTAGQSVARVILEVPLAKAGELVTAAKSLGEVKAISSSQNAAAPGGALAKARLEVIFATPANIVSRESDFSANLRHGLAISANGLLASVKYIVVGLCFVLPWAVVLWAGVKIFKRRKTATPAA